MQIPQQSHIHFVNQRWSGYLFLEYNESVRPRLYRKCYNFTDTRTANKIVVLTVLKKSHSNDCASSFQLIMFFNFLMGSWKIEALKI